MAHRLAFSAWIVEQLARHHNHYFDTEFERIEDSPEEFDECQGINREE